MAAPTSGTLIPPPPPGQPGPNLIDIINAHAEKADPIIKLLQSTMETYQKGQEREAKFSRHMAWLALGVVVVIVGWLGS